MQGELFKTVRTMEIPKPILEEGQGVGDAVPLPRILSQMAGRRLASLKLLSLTLLFLLVSFFLAGILYFWPGSKPVVIYHTIPLGKTLEVTR